ncbi:merozoite surface protein 9 [Patella vulgata]|uniref:merozoite surface protein 9 n=1 Tax=Patella vulgata TaxID=6465 RepID=UPI0024A80773|nr:merozoite surface protein 9 [Patella vulgata]
MAADDEMKNENVKTTDVLTPNDVEDGILDREIYSDSDDDNLLHYCQVDDDEEDETQESAPKTPQIPDDTQKDSEEQLVPNSQTKNTKSTETENVVCSATTPNKTNLQKPLKSVFAIPREPTRNLRPRKRTNYDENTVEIPSFKSGISPKMFGLLKNRSTQNKNRTALKDSRNVTRHEMEGQNELEIAANKKPASKKTPKIKTMPGLFDEYEIEMTSESESKKVHDKLVDEFLKFEKSNRSNDTENKEKKNKLRENLADELEDNGKPAGSLDTESRSTGRNIETHLEKKESKNRGGNPVDLKHINEKKKRDNPLDDTNEQKKGNNQVDVKHMNKEKSLEISGQNLEGGKRPLKKKKRDKIIPSAVVKLSRNPISKNDEIPDLTNLSDEENLNEEHMNIHVINDIQDEDMNINEHIDEEEDMNINEHIDEDMNIHVLDTLSRKFKMPSFLQPETLSSSYNDDDNSVPGNNMTGNTTLEKVLLKLRQIGSQSSPEIPADDEEGESPRLLSPTLSGVSELSSLSEAEFKNVDQKSNKTDEKMVKPVKKVKANSAQKRKTVVMDMFQEITPPDKKHTAKQRRLAASNKSSSASNFGILFYEEDIFL